MQRGCSNLANLPRGLGRAAAVLAIGFLYMCWFLRFIVIINLAFFH